MTYEILPTTAEDIIAVVDAVLIMPHECTKDFVCRFTDLTEAQALNALSMAQQLSLITFDYATSCYEGKSFLARLLVSSNGAVQKAAVLRLIIEEYKPFILFKARFLFCDSVDSAAKQIKEFYSMQTAYRDIKSTLISVATYCKAMTDEGANMYKFAISSHMEIITSLMDKKTSSENTLMLHLGQAAYSWIEKSTVFNPLADAYAQTNNSPIVPLQIVQGAGNAFESFLVQFATRKNISLSGKNGIIQKANALPLSKKHKGLIEYIGQVRNAADHGADISEGGKVWNISEETARTYPFLVANLIRSIIAREDGVLDV